MNSKIEGVATPAAKGSSPPLVAVVNDSDFDLLHTVDSTKASIPERAEVFPRP